MGKKVDQIGFLGAGQMGRALARGIVDAEVARADSISAFDPHPPARELFQSDIPGAKLRDRNRAVVEASDIVIVAVKPQTLPTVFGELEGCDVDGTLFLSIVAGVPLTTLCEGLGTERVVRAMPNTPCLVGSGAAGYALGPGASDEDDSKVKRLLESVGLAFGLAESLLDAVTGLSGSGPAYIYVMIEALSDGGVRMGLPRSIATALAAQTCLGAARMVLENGEHPGVLKDRVTSPGGTTIAGLQTLERHGVRSALIDAVQAAAERSQQLGRPA